MKITRVLHLGLFCLCIGLSCYGLIYYQLQQQVSVQTNNMPYTGASLIGGDFILSDQDSRPWLSSDHRGKYLLVYFGYSFCPDICPLGLQNMSGALEKLGRNLDDIVPVFITIDPERDTPQTLKIYKTNFHPRFAMLSGSRRAIDSVLKKYKVYAVKAKPDGTVADYLMDHSTLIYLLDRKGEFLKSFPHTIDPQELANALALILAHELKNKSGVMSR